MNSRTSTASNKKTGTSQSSTYSNNLVEDEKMFARLQYRRKQASRQKAKIKKENADKASKKKKAKSSKKNVPDYNSQAGYDYSGATRYIFFKLWASLDGFKSETSDKFYELCKDLDLPSPEPFLNECADFAKHAKYFRRSVLFASFFQIMNMLVTLGWLEHIEWEYKGVTILKSESLRQPVTVMDLVEGIGTFVKTFLTCLGEFLTTFSLEAFYVDAVKSKYEDDFTMLTSKKVLVESGRLDMDQHEYDRILAEMSEKTLTLLDNCKDGERSYYGSKLKELKSISISRYMAQKDSIRIKPYGVLLFGGSAVGKSSLAMPFLRYMLAINDFDSSPRSIITLNEFDKFQSEYRSYHAGVIFDDLANATQASVEGNPLMKVIQFINNVPIAALNPNVDMKGNVMIEPMVVLGTTNVKDLNAGVYSNEPLSINRRFQVTISMSVKPEYCQDGTTMLDPKKIQEAFGDSVYPDHANYTVEYAVAAGGVERKGVKYLAYDFNGKKLENIGIKELLTFIKEDSEAHFIAQTNFVNAQRAQEVIELGDDGLPTEFDSQFFGIFDDVKEYILLREEIIMCWLEERWAAFLQTKEGYLLLTTYYEIDLVRPFYRQGYFLVFMFLMSLFFEMAGFRTMIFFLMVFLWTALYVLIHYNRKREQLLRTVTNLPRLSRYIAEVPWTTKLKIISAFGGMATIGILTRMVRKAQKLPTSQGYAPIFRKKDKEDVKPWWGSENKSERELAYKLKVNTPQETKTMTTDQLIASMKKRQYLLKVGPEDNAKFCNAVPLRSSILLIPNHMVPKKTMEARIIKDGAHPKNVFLHPESTLRIPKTDYALWYLPEMGDHKDIVGYFADPIARGKKVTSIMLFNDCGKVKRFPPMLLTRGHNSTTEGGEFESLTYSFPGETFNGLCMATLIAENNKGEKFIPGFHLAGKGSFGCAGALTRQQLLDGIANLNTKPTILASHSAMPFPDKIAGIDVKLSTPHEKSVVTYLPPAAKCKIYGGHEFPRGTPKSHVRVSDISQTVTEVMGLERLHDQPSEMAHIRHQEVDILDKVDTAYKFQGDSIEKAYVDFETTLLGGMNESMYEAVGVLPDDAIISGIDGVQGVNSMVFNTSAGFPFRGTKEQFTTLSDRYVEGITCPRDVHPLITDEVERLEETLARGDRVNLVFKGALKDEPTKTTKTKVRVFAGCNYAATILVRKYYLSLSALMQKNKILFECAVAINPCSPEWTSLMKHIYSHGEDRVIAGDYKSFDRRMSPRFMLAAFKILIKIAENSGNFEPRDLTIMSGIATEICNPTYDYFGTLVQFFGSNPSGHPLTVVINSMVNSLYMRYCYFEIAKQDKWWKVPRFNTVVSLMTYGDDNIMSVKSGFDAYNHTRIAEVFSEAGITYTMADKEAKSVPFIKGSEAGFLKRDAIWDDELGLYRARLDEESISKSLHAHIESKVITEQQHCAEAIIGAMDEYFEYGREFYNKRREQLHVVAQTTDLTGLVGTLMTYDEQLTRFCERNEWELAKS